MIASKSELASFSIPVSPSPTPITSSPWKLSANRTNVLRSRYPSMCKTRLMPRIEQLGCQTRPLPAAGLDDLAIHAQRGARVVLNFGARRYGQAYIVTYDFLADFPRPEPQILHIPFGARRVAPAQTIMLRRRGVIRAPYG